MGKPVRILDLAHDMIRLCGYEPDVDIPIEIVGPRPGERLHERLVADDEVIEPGFGEGMFNVRCPEGFAVPEMMDVLRRCRQIVHQGDSSEACEFLEKMVPGMADQMLMSRPS